MTLFLGASMVLRYVFLVAGSWLLAPNEYGLLGVSLAILTIGGLIFSPFPWALTKYTSENKGNVAFKSVLMSNAVLAIAFVAIIVAGYSTGVLHIETKYRLGVLLVVITTAISAIGGIYEGALRGLLRFRELGLVRVIDQALILCGLAFVLAGWGVSGALLGLTIAFSVATLLLWYFCRDARLTSGGRWWEPSVHAYGWPMLVGGASAYLLMNLDIIGLKVWGGEGADAMAGQYQAIQVLARMPLIIVLGTVLEAYFSFIARNAGDKVKVEAYVNRMIRYGLIFCVPIALVIAIVPRQLLGALFPPAYASAAPALSILAIGTFLLVFDFILSRTLQAAVGPGAPAVTLLGAAALQIGLLYLLTPRYGLMGAASSTAIASFAALLGLGRTYLRHHAITLPWRALGALAAASACLAVLLVFLPMTNIAALMGGLLVGALLFFAVLTALRGIVQEDVDMVLSGMLGSQSKIRAGVVRLVRVLNRAPSVADA